MIHSLSTHIENFKRFTLLKKIEYSLLFIAFIFCACFYNLKFVYGEYVYSGLGCSISSSSDTYSGKDKTVTITIGKDHITGHGRATNNDKIWGMTISVLKPDGSIYNAENKTESHDDHSLNFTANQAGVYAISYSVSVDLSGDDDYTMSGITTFVMNPMNVPNYSHNISINKTKFNYNGEDQKPEITKVEANNGGNIVIGSNSYTVTYEKKEGSSWVGTAETKNVGDYRLVLNFKGNFSGTVYKTFSIDKIEGGGVLSFDNDSVIYNGKEQKPKITSLIVNGLNLVGGNDYNINWGSGNYTDAGEYTVTANFSGNVEGSATKTFTINKQNIGNFEVEYNPKEAIYSGESIYPEVNIYDEVGNKIDSSNYVLDWSDSDMTSIGQKKVDVAFSTELGEKNYTGNLSNQDFKILPKNAENAIVKLSESSVIYDSEEHKPTINSIILDNLSLSKTTDYIANWDTNDFTNVGIKKLTIDFKNNFSGTKTIEYEIKPKDASGAEVTLYNDTFDYNRNEQKAIVKSVKLGDLDLKASDYDIEYNDSDYINAGQKSIKLKFKGNYSGEREVFYNIRKVNVSDAIVRLSNDDSIFNGTAQKPDIEEVRVNGLVLANDDYNETWDNYDFISAGKKNLKISGINNFEGEKVVEYTIKPKNAEGAVVELSQDSFEYNFQEQKPFIKSVKLGDLILTENDYSINWDSENYTDHGEKFLTLNFTGNYEGSSTKRFFINPKDASNAEVEINPKSGVYDGNMHKPEIEKVTFEGKILTENTDYTYGWDTEDFTSMGSKKLTLSFKGNYTGTKEVIYNIYDADSQDASNAEVRLVNNKYVYNGQEQKAEIASVIFGSITLSNVTDYDIDYVNFDYKNVGTKTIILKFKNHFYGEKKINYEIIQADLNNAEISFSQNDVEFNGKPQKPSKITVTLDGRNLTEEQDYDETWDIYDFTSAGKKTLTIRGTHNYKGSASAEYRILPKHLSDAEVELSQTVFEYNSKEQKPAIKSVKVETLVLTVDDYNVIWNDSDNTNIGEKSLKLEFKNNYSGSSSNKTFEITKRDASNANVELDFGDVNYDGQKHKPTIKSVTLGDLSLKSEDPVDYTFNWDSDNFTNVGTRTLTLTFKGNFKGTKNVQFRIHGIDASNATVRLTDERYSYDGNEHKPGILSVQLNDLFLHVDEDYVVSYDDSDYANAGTKSLTLKFRGNYEGEKKVTYEISKFNVTDAEISVSPNNFEFNSQVQRPNIVVSVNGCQLTDSDYDLIWKSFDYISAGSKSFTIKFKNNYEGETSSEYTIASKDASNASIELSQDSFEYNAEEQKPFIKSVKIDNLILNENDYDIDWGENDYSKVGEKTFTVNFKGNYSGSATKKINIVSRDASNADVELDFSEFNYDGQEHKPEIKSVTLGNLTLSSSDYKYSWDTTDFTSSGVKTLTLKFEGNFKGEKKIEYKIKGIDASNADVVLLYGSESNEELVYNGQEQKATVSSVTLGDLELSAENDYDVLYEDENYIDAGTKSITLKFKGSYEGTKKIEYEIFKAKVENPEINISPNNFEFNGQVQKPNVSIIVDGTQLAEEDYDIIWKSFDYIFVGSKPFTIKFKNNYEGEMDAEYAIVTKDASSAVIELSQDSFEYNNENQKPYIKSVKLGDLILAEEKDYDLTWNDEDSTNVGKKSLTLEFKGNYSGSATKTFEILKKDASEAKVELSQNAFEYNSKEQKPFIKSVKLGNLELKEEQDYDLFWNNEDNINIGEKSLTLEFKGNYSGKTTLNYTIDVTRTSNISSSDTGETSIVDSDKPEWGSKMFTKNGITHYVTDDGETSVEVIGNYKIWLYEESGGTGAWYCVDNKDGVFKTGSRLSVKWLRKSENPEQFEEEFSKLDDDKKSKVDENKCELFLISVIDPDGNKYTNFGKNSEGKDIKIDLYIQIGEDWDENDIKAWYLSTSVDEIVDAMFVSMNSPEKSGQKFALLRLKHFSTYIVYDEVNDVVDNNDENNDINDYEDTSDYDKLSSRALSSSGTVTSDFLRNLFNYTVFILLILSLFAYTLTFKKKKVCFEKSIS